MSSETSQPTSEQPASPQAVASSTSPIPQRPAPQRTSTEIRRCWVCMGDETDDTSDNTSWRSPCPCSLTAHEECLLEWIADKEAPSHGPVSRIAAIKCPQCQAPIRIQRPRDILVDVVEVVQRGVRLLIIPTAALGFAGCIYTGLLTYGINTVAVVFGSQEAEQYLAPALNSRYPNGEFARAALNLIPFFPKWRGLKSFPYFVYLPTIAPVLISLRTDLGTSGLPILMPFALLHFKLTTQKYFLPSLNRNLVWPPSPDLAFATLPFLRSIYYRLYKHAFADLEKKWDLAVQRTPREGETAEQIAANAVEEEEEEQAIFELEIVREERQIRVPDPNADANAGQANDLQEGAQVEGANPPAAEEGDAPAAGGGWRQNFDIRQDVSATLSADTIMGALFFPAISAAVGELIKLSLPSRFVMRGGSKAWGGNGKGLLMEKWGRTLVGGCVFVVLKDAVGLYCKWKRARDFGSRRVLDFVGEKKRRTADA